MRTEDKKSALDWAQEYNRVDTISVLEREMKKRQDENENDENGSDVKETGNDDADGDDNGDDTGDGGGQDNHSDHVDGVVAGDQSQQNVKKVRFDSRCQTSDGDSVSVSPASASKHSAMSRVVGEGRGGKGGGMDWEAMLTGGIGAVMGMGMSAGKSVSELCMDGAGGLTVATHSDVHKSMAGADGKCISSHTSHNTDHGDYDDDIPQLDDNDLDVVNLKTKMSSSSRPTSTPPPALQASSSPPAWSYAALSMPLPSSSPSRIAQCFLRLCMQESAVKHRVQSRTEKGDREARDGLCELDFLSMVMARREMDPAFCVDDIMLFLKVSVRSHMRVRTYMYMCN